MPEPEECIVTGEIKKLLCLLRIFGLAPVHTTPEPVLREYGTGTVNCYRISLSKRSRIISIIFIFIIWLVDTCTSIYFTFIMDPRHSIRIRKGLSLVLYGLHRTVLNIILLFIAFRGWNTVKRTITYLNNIQKLNQALHNSYVNLEVKKANQMIWGFSISINIIALMFICGRIMDVFVDKKDVSILVVQSIYFLTFTMQILIQLQFAFIMYLLNATIRILNHHLQYWNSGWDYDILDSLYLIMSSIACFTYGDTLSPYANFALKVVWIIYRGATLVLLIEPCNETDTELQVLKQRVINLICTTNNNYDREELLIFSRLLVIDLPVFSPLGVIALRRQELVTVMGLLFSFVVIITQFHLRDGIKN